MAPWNLFQSVSDPGTSVRMSKALGFRSKISRNSCQVFCIFWKCKFLMSLIYKITNRKSFVDLNFKEWVYEIYKSAYLDIIMISIFIKFTKESCTVFYYNLTAASYFGHFCSRGLSFLRGGMSGWPGQRTVRDGTEGIYDPEMNISHQLTWIDLIFIKSCLLMKINFLFRFFTSAFKH